MQVTSRKSKGKVKKLLYIWRGPYTVTKTFESGSYELTPIANGKQIKKHGSTLFLCPEKIYPYQPLSTSLQ